MSQSERNKLIVVFLVWAVAWRFFFLGLAAGDQAEIGSYGKAREVFWAKLYPGDGHDLYCGSLFKGKGGLNIEHVYAASWMGEYLGCGSRVKCRASSDPSTRKRFNHMEGDLHNLWPALATINKARSNYSFGIISGEYRKPLKWCDFEYRRTTRVAEPRPAVRGEIARSIFYMSDEYGLPIDPRMIKLLIEWNKADPPSSHERWRNDRIESLQGTRNKFIDDPQLGDHAD
jgi:deoxyribonuclease-1